MTAQSLLLLVLLFSMSPEARRKEDKVEKKRRWSAHQRPSSGNEGLREREREREREDASMKATIN
jgi:hypothetical protein